MYDKIIAVPEEIVNRCPHGLGYMLFECMQKYKNNIAQIDISSGNEDTYCQLLQRCIRTSLELTSRGVTREDIIVLNTNNHLDSSVPFIAAQFLGCRVASLDPSIALEDARFLLEQVNPRIIFCISSCEEIMSEAIDRLSKKPDIIVFGTEGFNEFTAPKDEEYRFEVARVDQNETAVILFSSGTTGYPKGICANHKMLAKAGNSYMGSCKNRINICYATLYWISTIMTLLESCRNGDARLLIPKFDSSEFWDIVEEYKATSFYTNPTQMIQIIKNKPKHKMNMDSMVSVVIGGGPVPIDYINDFGKTFPHIIISQAWGQSELGIITRFQHTDPKQMDLLRKSPLSCGMILPGFTAKIVDPDTNNILGANEVGEIRIKSAYQMNGYHNKDSTEVWDSDGFICTGDLGYYDDNKCLFIVDRLKEMLKYQSWHVTPAKIESVLLKHPAVLDAVVIGKPHADDGDHPLALVVPNKQKMISILPEDIQNFSDKQMDDRHKLRGGVIFVNKLLYTPSGKLKRSAMKSLILSGHLSF